jgi:hypothetical protein
LEKFLASEGMDLPEQLIECGSIGFTKALVVASDHLAMLPEHADLSTKDKLKPLPLVAPDIAVISRYRSGLDKPRFDSNG